VLDKHAAFVHPVGAEFGVDLVSRLIDGQFPNYQQVLPSSQSTRSFVDRARHGALRYLGGVISPFNAWLIMLGMHTYPLRVQRQNQTALELARFLEDHPAVAWVRYPGLESHPQYTLACRQMRGFGGMVAFELRGGIEAGARMMDRVRLCTLAVSLGHTKSLICHSASTTHSTLSREERLAAGITDGLVRLSVGLEDAADLMLDLDQAMR